MSRTLKQLRHDELHPNPTNTRQDPGDCTELADSIAGIGLNVPIDARPNENGHEIVSGWRRWTAIGILIADGRAKPEDTWPVLVRKGADAKDDVTTAANIVENLHRADVTPLEEFRGLARLAGEHGWTADQIAAATGISAQTVKARLKWMSLSDEQLVLLTESGRTTETITKVARLPQASIDEIFADGLKGYELGNKVNDVFAARRHQSDISKIRNQLRRAGHLVVGSGCGDEKDAEAAAALVSEQKKQAHADGHTTEMETVSQYGVDHLLEEGELPVPSVFFIEKDKWRIPIKVHVIERPPTAEEIEQREAAKNDFQRASDEASADYHRRREEYAEAKQEAQKAFVFDTKTSDLIARVLHFHVAECGVRVAADASKLLGLETTSIEGLVEYADKSAADLARAAAACAIHATWPKLDVPDFDLEQPSYERPNPDHYDEDGNYVGEQTLDDQADDDVGDEG